MIAEGAGHFRQPRLVERLARRLSSVPMSAALRARLKRWYVAALTIQSGGRGLSASLPGGEIVRVLPEHAHVGWNPDEYRAFREAIRPGVTALDVGANVGAYSLLLGQWVGPSGSVHAFEPAPQAFEGLVKHIELNGLQETVHPVRAAAGASSSPSALFVSSTQGESRLASVSDHAMATLAVPVTTIDEYCDRYRLTPAFIKIDVEGAERDVLRGARETIRRTRGALALFVEMHPSIWPHIGVSRREVETEIGAQSLAVEPLIPSLDPWGLEGVCVRLVAR
jgi:FkbM family methyltransferase